MPYIRKKIAVAVKTKKKYYRKKRVYNKGNPRIKYPVSPPIKQKICLKYTDIISTQLSVNNPTYYYMWRPNDIFDPNYTNAGHQHLYRDQMFLMYSFFRCVAWKLSVKIINESDTPILCALYQNDSATNADSSALLEYKGTRKAWVTKSKPIVLSMNFLVDRFLQNRKYTCLSDDTFKQDSSTTLQNNSTCWVGFFANYGGSQGSANLYLQWDLKTYGQFSEARAIQVS